MKNNAVTLKTPHYRIDDPNARLSVRFICEKSNASAAPKVFARLTKPADATTFNSFAQAAECFAKYLAGATLDIVRVDAV
jgi:hypothetical protein